MGMVFTLNGARNAALYALESVASQEAFADLVLSQIHAKYHLTPLDRALANELTRGVLRWQKRLDWIIDSLYTGSPDKLPLSVRLALRLGLYQIIFLDKVPEFAAINESVNLIKHSKFRRWKNVVNAVLREFTRSGNNLVFPASKDDPIKAIAVSLSHPEWLVERWVKRYGEEQTKALCAANNSAASVCIRTNSLLASRWQVENWFKKTGLNFSLSKYLKNFFRVRGFAQIESHQAFKSGWFSVQDESAGLVAVLLSPKEGDRVIDLCAAPGGKTTHIAELMHDTGLVVANDKNFNRLKLIRKSVKRLNITSVSLVNSGGSLFAAKPVDRVLVDAPCSGLGVLAKKPDLRWRRSVRDISTLAKIQQQLLANAARLVRIGGIIVYSTCTIEPDENDNVIHQFLTQHDNFSVENAGNFVPRLFVNGEGFIRTLPHLHKMDGSFAVRMRRIS